jgi:signal transduction histidine kinase
MMSGMFRTGLTLGLLYLFNLTTVAQPVPEALKMAISGQENDEKKLELYKILLDSISTAERKDFLPVIKYAKEAIDLSVRLKDPKYVPLFYNELGFAYKQSMKVDSAIYYLKRGLELAEQLQHPLGIARNGYTLATIYVDQHRLLDAVHQIHANLTHLKLHPYNQMYHVNYLLVAFMCHSMDNKLLYQYFFEKSYAYFPSDPQVARIHYEFKIRYLLMQKRVKDADALYAEFERLYPLENRKPMDECADIYMTIAEAYLRDGYYAKAASILDKLLETKLDPKSEPLYFVLAYRAKIYLQQGDVVNAERLNNLTLRQPPLAVLQDHRRLAFENLARINYKKGNYFVAIEQIQQLYMQKDSIEKAKNALHYLLVTNLQEAEKDVNAFTAQVQLQKAVLKKDKEIQRDLYIIIGLLFLMVLGAIYFYRRSNKNRALIEKQKEQLLKQAHDLSEANGVKDKLFSIVSHELRSPVAELITLLDVKKRVLKYESTVDYLDDLHVKSKRVYSTLDNVLSWSAAQLRLQDSAVSHQSIRHLASKAVALALPEITQKNLSIKNNTEEIQVLANENQTLMVLRNVLHNAVKFSKPAGEIQLYTTYGNGEVVLHIADQGTGMSAEKQASLFTTLQRSENGTEGEQGSGIGLYICADLMKKQGGRMGVKSIEGKGTTLQVTFIMG